MSDNERWRVFTSVGVCLRAITSVYEENLSVTAAADCLRNSRKGHFTVMRWGDRLAEAWQAGSVALCELKYNIYFKFDLGG